LQIVAAIAIIVRERDREIEREHFFRIPECECTVESGILDIRTRKYLKHY
jgi:hypothetical protein